jgi:hypothetical protein
MLASVCVLIVEPAKARLHDLTRHVRAMYLILVGYQLVLFADVSRSYVYDWWLWFLSFVHARPLSEAVNLNEVAGLRFPIVSGVVAVGLTAYLLFTSRLRRSRQVARSATDDIGRHHDEVQRHQLPN